MHGQERATTARVFCRLQLRFSVLILFFCFVPSTSGTTVPHMYIENSTRKASKLDSSRKLRERLFVCVFIHSAHQ